MKKASLFLSVLFLGGMMLSSCTGKGNNQKEDSEDPGIKGKAIEIVISDSLSIGKEYYQPTMKYFWGQSWITFKGSTVEFSVQSKDGWGNIIDRKDITGKYSVVNNNGNFTIECDFGKESVNIYYLTGGVRPIRLKTDYPLPNILNAEIDSLNNVIITDWEKV